MNNKTLNQALAYTHFISLLQIKFALALGHFRP